MTRLYGRSPIGERCVDHTPHGHWKTMTMLSAIRLDGVMQEATMVYDGPMNRDTFVTYIEHRLVPALRPGDIVIMDNLSSHKDAKVRELIEAADADLWYLPPYSPDLAPHWTLPSKSCGARSRRGCAASWPTRSTACWTRLPTPCERWAPANVPTISLRVGMEIIDAHCSSEQNNHNPQPSHMQEKSPGLGRVFDRLRAARLFEDGFRYLFTDSHTERWEERFRAALPDGVDVDALDGP